ncbi:hypothetical protein [Micromonospora rifamycinica]|uniref:Uncharacterized protein n=1 Tax=Micromonospora rifamycinica TaxID=291594 RepID=A0A120F8A0_9ACTN|nr:hypothetical protein [Micromonospora rifamycinica]KWV31446.1 hypothetical protein AWV63_17615 [Micromonospora rifamycinica]SCG43159.1 hypothetical protein GA0070623_0979 [Micromonospora rifamycinica]
MNFHRSARPGRTVDRAEAERLLDAPGPGVPPSADDPLARLLAAAAAPARPGELAGEQAAVAAFRAAQGAVAPASGVRRRRRLTTGVLAWIAGLAATATAGVAFAAVTLDDRPGERTPGPVPSASDTGSTSPTPHRTDPSRRPTAAPGGTSPGAAVPPATPPHGKPAGDGRWTGQCRAYLAKSPEQRAKALTKPGFAGLVDAAGGADRVEAYCRELVPDHPAPGPATGGPKGGAGPKGGTGPGSGGGPGGTPSPGPKN